MKKCVSIQFNVDAQDGELVVYVWKNHLYVGYYRINDSGKSYVENFHTGNHHFPYTKDIIKLGSEVNELIPIFEEVEYK